MTETMQQLHDVLQNVAMNRVERKDQEFALNLLAAIARDEGSVTVHKCVKLGISLDSYNAIQKHILNGDRIKAIKELKRYRDYSIMEAVGIIESPMFSHAEGSAARELL